MTQPASKLSFLVDHRPFSKETNAGEVTAIVKKVFLALALIALAVTVNYYVFYGLCCDWNPLNMPQSSAMAITIGLTIAGSIATLSRFARVKYVARQLNAKTDV